MSDSFNQLKKQLGLGLSSKRWSMKSITALILFGAIIMVFALFGLPNRMNGGNQAAGSAATVNHTLISLADLQSESSRMEQMYAPLFGGNGIGDAQRQFVRQQALESLIMQEVSFQSAKKQGILATDAEVQDVIVKDIPVFQKNGRFQRDLYYQLLQANNLTPVEFEAKLRKEKINNRTQNLFLAASQPLSIEIEKVKALQESKMNVAFAKIEKDQILKNLKTGDLQTRLAQPEFAQKVQDYYNNNKAEFAVEPQVHAQHILVKIDSKTDAAKAKAKIEEIRKQAQTEDFAKLAKQFSEDEGSKSKGGDLGTFGQGKMVPEFEKAAFSQPIGQVGEPVQSSFGFHLIKVLDRKEAGQKPFDQVRTEIAQKLVATDAYEVESKALEDAIAKGDSAAVDAQLKKMGVNWDETGFFDLNTEMVPKLSSLEASKAAFELTEAKPLYPKLVRDGSERFVLRLKATKKEAAPNAINFAKQISQERGSDLFRGWIEGAKKSSRIERNPIAVSGR